jgi:hypothetical protein
MTISVVIPATPARIANGMLADAIHAIHPRFWRR